MIEVSHLTKTYESEPSAARSEPPASMPVRHRNGMI